MALPVCLRVLAAFRGIAVAFYSEALPLHISAFPITQLPIREAGFCGSFFCEKLWAEDDVGKTVRLDFFFEKNIILQPVV